MDPISSHIVEKLWKKMAGMSPLEIPRLINQMTKQQPLILAYLMAVDDDIFNQDERELLLYLGVVIWQIMSQDAKHLPKIKKRILDKVEESNTKMLEYLEGESVADFQETVETIMINYNQQEILRYIVEALMEEEEEGCIIRAENKGIMMLDLKTVIDCFDH